VTPPNTFTGAALDRAGERRSDDGWVAAQRADPAARAVVAGREGVHVTGGEAPRLALVPLAEAGDGEPLLLGVGDGGPIFAAEGDASRLSLLGLREAAGALPQAESGLAAYAAALLNWHGATASARTAARRRRSGRRGTCAAARAAPPSTTRARIPW